MGGSDTSIGGAAGAFPNTTWGLVSRFGADATRHRRDSFETLCRRYWKPVYRTLRITRAKSNDDAKDITQAFFLWLTEGETLRRYDPGLGERRARQRERSPRRCGSFIMIASCAQMWS